MPGFVQNTKAYRKLTMTAVMVPGTIVPGRNQFNRLLIASADAYPRYITVTPLETSCFSQPISVAADISTFDNE